MPFQDYLRLEGWSSVVLGLELVVAAALLGDWDAPWLAVVTAVVLSPLAWIAGRRAVRSAVQGTPARRSLHEEMAAGAIRRQVLVETGAWIVGVTAWLAVGGGSSAELIAGTGVASVAFGAARVTSEVPAALRVVRRRYFRTPELRGGPSG